MTMFGQIRDKIMEHQPAPAMPDLSGAIAAGMETLAQDNVQPVDVEQVLQDISRQKGDPELNWRSSIVDLMKLLGLDSSLANRAELATELGYEGQKNGSAEMNIWLHRRVMDELEKSGGTVPETLKN